MPRQPLAEVFGFPISNLSAEAERHRKLRLCPFNNRVPNCTKDKADDPLGVCSVRDGEHVVVTCPIRFRERWLVVEQAAAFFFPPQARWTSLTEVRLNDKNGKPAGDLDVVLVSLDDRGRITDFGALEIQAVYISGNIRLPFEHYMSDPPGRADMVWQGRDYPRPDYLSSSRKRLAPQLIFKGGILSEWGKKMAVAVDRHFFATLPSLPATAGDQAQMGWLIYDLVLNDQCGRYDLTGHTTVYTQFAPALAAITTAEAGSLDEFIGSLQRKLDSRTRASHPPDAPTFQESHGAEQRD